jgi:hypothetical protein
MPYRDEYRWLLEWHPVVFDEKWMLDLDGDGCH